MVCRFFGVPARQLGVAAFMLVSDGSRSQCSVIAPMSGLACDSPRASSDCTLCMKRRKMCVCCVMLGGWPALCVEALCRLAFSFWADTRAVLGPRRRRPRCRLRFACCCGSAVGGRLLVACRAARGWVLKGRLSRSFARRGRAREQAQSKAQAIERNKSSP